MFSGQFPYSQPTSADSSDKEAMASDVLAWAFSRVGLVASVNGANGWELMLGWQRMFGEDMAMWCVQLA